MLQVVNASPFATGKAVLLSPAGEHIWTVCVKGTYHFDFDGSLSLHSTQEPVCQQPVYAREPGNSTMLRDCELVVEHPGSAITLNARAHSPSGRAEAFVDVQVAVGPVRLALRVYGDRSYHGRTLRGVRVSDPVPFTSMPIVYERAFGGVDPETGLPLPQNPVGTGYATSDKAASGLRLPNVTALYEKEQGFADLRLPAGLCAIAPSWSPRKELAGTADEKWIETRAPLWPGDWNALHCNAAPGQLQTKQKLHGGETVSLINLASQNELNFQLPRVFFDMRTKFPNGYVRNEVGLDRVIIEPEKQRLVMVWRSALNCGRDARRVVVTYVDTKLNTQSGQRDGTA